MSMVIFMGALRGRSRAGPLAQHLAALVDDLQAQRPALPAAAGQRSNSVFMKLCWPPSGTTSQASVAVTWTTPSPAALTSVNRSTPAAATARLFS